MVDERKSPSAGWQTVYREMAADPGVEEATHPCPDCDRTCENVLRDVYECETHGVFRASADDGEKPPGAGPDRTDVADAGGTNTEQTDADDPPDDPDEVANRAREPAD